jgi:hypothetical protein
MGVDEASTVTVGASVGSSVGSAVSVGGAAVSVGSTVAVAGSVLGDGTITCAVSVGAATCVCP